MAVSDAIYYITHMSATSLFMTVIVSLIIGQFLFGVVANYWIGFPTYHAGPGIQIVFYLAGVLTFMYTIGHFKPRERAPEGLTGLLTLGLIFSIVCFIIGIYALPILNDLMVANGVPSLFTVLPMQADLSIPPFSVVPLGP